MNSRNPMPSAWREQVYGKLQPLETTAAVIRIGGMPALALFACGIVATFALVAFGG